LDAIARRIAEPRALRAQLLRDVERAHGLQFGPELNAYIRAFETYELETSDPSGAELRIPEPHIGFRAQIEEVEPAYFAGFIGLFTGASVIAQQDELSYLASWAGTESGASKVYHFHPDDWGLWPTDHSIASRLSRFIGSSPDDDLNRETLPMHLDPLRVFPRVGWLVHTFLTFGRDFERELAAAATMEDFAREREYIARSPHLLLYWMWSQHFLQRPRHQDEVLPAVGATTSVAVLESHELIERLQQGRDVRLGERTAAGFAELRARFLGRLGSC
jgi:hypothetical protein